LLGQQLVDIGDAFPKGLVVGMCLKQFLIDIASLVQVPLPDIQVGYGGGSKKGLVLRIV
jgi:hypothetical protein